MRLSLHCFLAWQAGRWRGGGQHDRRRPRAMQPFMTKFKTKPKLCEFGYFYWLPKISKTANFRRCSTYIALFTHHTWVVLRVELFLYMSMICLLTINIVIAINITIITQTTKMLAPKQKMSIICNILMQYPTSYELRQRRNIRMKIDFCKRVLLLHVPLSKSWNSY